MPLCGAGSSFEAKEPKLRGFRLPRTPKRHLKRRGLGCYLKKLPKSLAPRRNELRYTQYNQRLNCCTLRYCSLIEKIPRFFFEEEKQRKSSELLFFWPGTGVAMRSNLRKIIKIILLVILTIAPFRKNSCEFLRGFIGTGSQYQATKHRKNR